MLSETYAVKCEVIEPLINFSTWVPFGHDGLSNWSLQSCSRSLATGFGFVCLCLPLSLPAAEFSLVIPREVRVHSGEDLSVPLRVSGASNSMVTYRALNAPKGARITQAADGAVAFVWSSPATLLEKTIVIITATANDGRLAKSSARLSIVPEVGVDSEWVIPAQSTLSPNRLPHFPGLGVQALQVAVPYKLWMRADDPDTGSAQIQAELLPAGAVLLPQSNGGYSFLWTPRKDQLGAYSIRFLAIDSSDPALRVERRIEFMVRSVDVQSYDQFPKVAADGRKPTKHPEFPDAGSPVPAVSILASSSTAVSPIGIEPLSTQIIGVGQVVSFPVIPIVTEGTEAALQVDRLPKGATFEVNPLGVRVFRWETNEADEGEHVFRVSVFDKQNPAARAQADVSVIVGNPTARSTVPKPLPAGQAPTLDVPQ